MTCSEVEIHHSWDVWIKDAVSKMCWLSDPCSPISLPARRRPDDVVRQPRGARNRPRMDEMSGLES